MVLQILVGLCMVLLSSCGASIHKELGREDEDGAGEGRWRERETGGAWVGAGALISYSQSPCALISFVP